MESIFCLLNYNSLFDKIKYEKNLLKANKKNPVYDYTIINLVISFNHIFEWIMKDDLISEEHKIKCFIEFNPYVKRDDCKDKELLYVYKKIEKDIQCNINQYLIRELCNQVKHLQKKNKKIAQITDKKGQVLFGECLFGEHLLGHYDYLSYAVENCGIEYDVETIINRLFCEWDKFIAEINI